MTFVGGEDNSLALMQFVTQLKQHRQSVEREKALTLLQTLRPGELLSAIPGGMEAFKTATGRESDPNRPVQEETIEHFMDKSELSTILGMTPQQQTAIAQNRLLNKATGTAGRQTVRSFKSAGDEVEAAAATRAGTARAAQQSIAGSAPQTQAKIGERQIYGETGGQTVAGEATARAGATTAEAGASVNKATADMVTGFMKDPDNSAWGKQLTQFGINPTGAAEAFATGQGSLLTGMLNYKQQELQGSQQTTQERLQQSGRLQEQLNQGRITAAQEMSKVLGGAIGVRTILALENAVEMGQDPYKSGVSSADVQTWLKAKQLGMGGYVKKQINENNPQTQLLNNIVTNMKTFAADPKLSTAANTLAAQTIANIYTEGELGMPRPSTPGEARDAWDKQARYNYSVFGMVGKNASGFLGIDWAGTQQGDAKSTPPAPYRAEATVDTTTPKAAGTPASKPPAMPKLVDPAAARAVSRATQFLTDSTNIKR